MTLMIMAQYGLLGTEVGAPVDLSYLADTVVLLRYFEAFGQVRQAISTVKKRTGTHEHSIRELQIGHHGLRVGRELRDFQGVLSGQLDYLGEEQPLIDEGADA
jgi:circadian clock protein KaiC